CRWERRNKMAEKLVLALDLGTTSAKAVIFEQNGKLVAEAERMITSHYPKPGWVEQDPVEIERSAVGAIHDVIGKAKVAAEQILTVSSSAAMHSLICVDQNVNPLSGAIIWADGRSSQQAKELKQENGFDIYKRTGLPN